jgi:predicted dehydrogenase
MDKVKIGIVGSGFMGRTHAEAIQRYILNAELAAIAGGSRAQQLAKDYGVEFEEAIETLLGREDIDAVMVTTPHAQHAEPTIHAARNGKHVLVEKPMATTVKDCDAMVEACHAAGVNLMVGQMQRYRRCNLLAKQLIDEGRIGKVLMMRESQLGTVGATGFPSWQSDPENVGLLIGHGIHNLDRLRWMAGSEVKRVCAWSGSKREQANIDLSAMVLLNFESGAVANFWFSWECPTPGFPRSEFRAWIMGEEGLLDIDAYGKLQLGIENSWELVYEQPPIDYRGDMLAPIRMQTYVDQDQEFINSILEDRRPAVPGEDGRAAVEIAIAAYRSSKIGAAISLPLARE